jgi:hypothetical protein
MPQSQKHLRVAILVAPDFEESDVTGAQEISRHSWCGNRAALTTDGVQAMRHDEKNATVPRCQTRPAILDVPRFNEKMKELLTGVNTGM